MKIQNQKPIKGIATKINDEEPAVFISPWQVHYVYLVFLLIPFLIFATILIRLFLLTFIPPKWFVWLCLIFLFCNHLWFRYANHIFYVYKKNHILRILNPYYPFVKDIIIPFEDIDEVHFFERPNRIKVFSKNKEIQIFICANLEIDMFDEHLVEITFDDFYNYLKSCGINIHYINPS